MIRHLVFAFLAVALSISSLSAAPILFTHSGVGAGRLNGESFPEAAFTITAVGDTASRNTVASDLFSIDHASAAITIEGLGEFQFITPTSTYVSQNATQVGITRSPTTVLPSPLYWSATTDELGTWDMLTSIGPIHDSGVLFPRWDSPDFLTDGGTLVFFAFQGIESTFEAVIVPEPSSLALMFIGLIAVGCLRASVGRRR